MFDFVFDRSTCSDALCINILIQPHFERSNLQTAADVVQIGLFVITTRYIYIRELITIFTLITQFQCTSKMNNCSMENAEGKFNSKQWIEFTFDECIRAIYVRKWFDAKFQMNWYESGIHFIMEKTCASDRKEHSGDSLCLYARILFFQFITMFYTIYNNMQLHN